MEPRVLIKVLQTGDSVLAVHENRIVIARKSGDVDIVPLTQDASGLLRIDADKICRITKGNNEVIVRGRPSSEQDDDPDGETVESVEAF